MSQILFYNKYKYPDIFLTLGCSCPSKFHTLQVPPHYICLVDYLLLPIHYYTMAPINLIVLAFPFSYDMLESKNQDGFNYLSQYYHHHLSYNFPSNFADKRFQKLRGCLLFINKDAFGDPYPGSMSTISRFRTIPIFGDMIC